MNERAHLPFVPYVSIGLMVVTAIGLMLWITPYGAGLTPDSTVYIGGAKSMLSGMGFSLDGSPITHFPPLYPLLLAAIAFLVKNYIQAARVLNALLFGMNAGLIAFIVYFTAGRSLLAGVLGAVYFVSTAPFLELHAMAWSEPLFIAFLLASIMLLTFYVKEPTLSLLIASSLCLGCAVLTRYIGVAFLPAALVVIFVSRNGHRFLQRARDTSIAFAFACAPLLIFLTRNLLVRGSITDRNVVLHQESLSDYLRQLNEIAFVYIAPIPLPAGGREAVLGIALVALVILFAVLFQLRSREVDWHSASFVLPYVSLIFSASYLLFLFLSLNFLDAATPVDARLLSPVLIILSVGALSGLWAVSRKLNRTIVWSCFLVLLIASISAKVPDAIRRAAAIQRNGLGYTSRQWVNSHSVAFIRSFGQDVKIYSNWPEVLRVLTDKQSTYIPRRTDRLTMQANPDYGEQIAVMCGDIQQKRAVLLYFNRIDRWQFPTQEELEQECKMPILRTFRDGQLYGSISK